MSKYRKFSLLIIAVGVSFFGFCIENFFIAFSHGFIDNRNMILPFLFGYGLAILAFFKLFGTPHEPKCFGKNISIKSIRLSTIYYFIIAFLGVCVGELLLGHYIEWACGIIWWDYTRLPLHVTRYTSVPTSFCFATLITVFMKYFFTPLLNALSRLRPTFLVLLATVSVSLLALDMINSAIYMFQNHDTLHLWRLNFHIPFSELFWGEK